MMLDKLRKENKF